MPVCKDCGRQFGDGAFIYHECKSELRIAIDDCLANPAELRKEITDLKRKLDEAKYELANKNERIEFLEQMRDAAIQDNKLLNDLKEMWKQQSDNHLLHLCDVVTENESLKHQLAAIKDKND